MVRDHHLVQGNDNDGVSDDDEAKTSTDDECDNDDGRIDILDGLCPDVLAALMEFQMGHSISASRRENEMPSLSEVEFGIATVSQATSRSEDTVQIADTLRRLHDLEMSTSTADAVSISETTLLSPMNHLHRAENNSITTTSSIGNHSITHKYVNALTSDGVIRINHVLSKELCDACLKFTNQALVDEQETSSEHNQQQPKQQSNNDVADDTMLFGNVFEREHRFDMYLRPTGVIHTSLQSLLNCQSPLGKLFSALLVTSIDTDGTEEVSNAKGNQVIIPLVAPFHELSCLISDPGSIAQPLHPDSLYYPNQAPLWTVFVALQNVSSDMGGTVVVPGTHTMKFHDQLGPSSNNEFRSLVKKECSYQRADLSIGDCIVMDARTFHYGSANTSDQRRTLLYFTIRNPYHVQRGYPHCGSLYPDLDGTLTTAQYIL
jgi:Phytanoyl-CoA dioxygenase (PhyH)